MNEYLNYQFEDTKELADTFDETPLWSASFGLLMLKHLVLKPDLTVLDLGSGTGFPLIELAERLGKSCKLYGIDTWTNANNRAKQKIQHYQLTHVEVLEGSADTLPFEDGTVDLIVSNLGINNFENPPVVFKECCRVLKSSGKLALTTNLNGHWKAFYEIFENTLRQLGKNELVLPLMKSQEHRGNVESVSKLFTSNGFQVSRYHEDTFEMKFLDGSAFLNHHFVKLGWLSDWRGLIPQREWSTVFKALEENLNALAKSLGGLSLSVPMLFMEGKKE